MKPTLFTIPYLPEWLGEIKSYGVAMMIAFLSGIWLACRRADRSQANPDTVLNMGFLALVFGVAGARIMYVIHYWDTHFATRPNPFWSILDIRAGGLEFWGGPLFVIPVLIIYLRFIAKVSTRWYLDIGFPSLAWGLAITRVGCFMNGCCWGSVCAAPNDPTLSTAAYPWAVRFPYGSNAMNQQYRFGQLTLPNELVYFWESGESTPIPADWIEKAIEDDGKTLRDLTARKDAALKAYQQAQSRGADGATIKALEKAHLDAGRELSQFNASELGKIDRQCYRYGLTPAQLGRLAGQFRSKPVHPAQLYETTAAFIISWLLSVMFYYRRRHGIVVGWFLVLYSISRFLMELIRADNPLDTFGGLTISQGISLGTFAAGLLWLAVMYRLPTFSPRAIPFVYPEQDTAPKKKGS